MVAPGAGGGIPTWKEESEQQKAGHGHAAVSATVRLKNKVLLEMKTRKTVWEKLGRAVHARLCIHKLEQLKELLRVL